MSSMPDNLLEARERIGSLRAINGEGDPSRFARAEQAAAELGYRFFRVGRLSQTGEIYMGALRLALDQVIFKPEEKKLYQPWLKLTTYQEVVLAGIHQAVSAERLKDLDANDDPLMHVIDAFERVRTSPEYPEYNDISRDSVSMERIQAAYERAQRSIHGEPNFDATA